MKRKLVLKTEKLRVLTETRLARVAGGIANQSENYTMCSCLNSQMAICDLWGTKG